MVLVQKELQKRYVWVEFNWAIIDFLLVWGWWAGWGRDWWWWGWWGVIYCEDYELQAGNYSVVVWVWWKAVHMWAVWTATAAWNSCFNWIVACRWGMWWWYCCYNSSWCSTYISWQNWWSGWGGWFWCVNGWTWISWQWYAGWTWKCWAVTSGWWGWWGAWAVWANWTWSSTYGCWWVGGIWFCSNIDWAYKYYWSWWSWWGCINVAWCCGWGCGWSCNISTAACSRWGNWSCYWAWGWGWGMYAANTACTWWGWDWCQWVFIVRYPTACWYNVTWWTKYTCWNYTIHRFTSNWTLTIN